MGIGTITNVTINGLLQIYFSSFSQQMMTTETRSKAFSGDINKLLLIKNILQ